MNFHRCKCGWQMAETATRAIQAHDLKCPFGNRPQPEPFDADRVIDNAARGKAPAQPLNVFERATVLHRMLTMPPEDFFERVFRKPLLEEIEDIAESSEDDRT